MSLNALKPLPPALPETTGDFLAHRKLKTKRTLNDLVEEVHLELYEDEGYNGYLFAVYDEQAKEGSLACDNFEAATMIRARAVKTGRIELAKEKKATIAKALGVVLRRYGFARKDRRNMIGGVVIDGVNGNNGD